MKSGTQKLGSVSDLMSGLMMVFLFIAIAYMVQTEDDKIELIEKTESAEEQKDLAINLRGEAEKQRTIAEKLKIDSDEQRKEAENQRQLAQNLLKDSELRSRAIREITATFEGLQQGLYDTLEERFKDDLERWNATLMKDSTIRFNEPRGFNEPEVLFKAGEASLQPRFKEILKEFFPKYEAILSSDRFRDEIDEIRVEGHTSSEWKNASVRQERYIKNVELSQERALAVLKYSIQQIKGEEKEIWLSEKIRANGLSFAKLIKVNGIEDKAKSRRVEFRVVTKTREKIVKIIEELDEKDN